MQRRRPQRPVQKKLDDLRLETRVDGRTIVAKRLKAFRRALLAQLGTDISPSKRAQVELAVQLKWRLLCMDLRFGEVPDMTAHDSRTYLSWSNSLARLLARLEPKPEPVPKRGSPGRPPRTLQHFVDHR